MLNIQEKGKKNSIQQPDKSVLEKVAAAGTLDTLISITPMFEHLIAESCAAPHRSTHTEASSLSYGTSLRKKQRYLDLLALLPYPPAVLQHCHQVLVHLVVGLVPEPVLIALQSGESSVRGTAESWSFRCSTGLLRECQTSRLPFHLIQFKMILLV